MPTYSFPAAIFEVEGSPEAVREAGRAYGRFATTAAQAAANLRGLDSGAWVGSEGDLFRALDGFADALEGAQGRLAGVRADAEQTSVGPTAWRSPLATTGSSWGESCWLRSGNSRCWPTTSPPRCGGQGPPSSRTSTPRPSPVSQELAAALMRWAEEFDRTLNQGYPPDSGFPLERDRRAFLERGRHLAGRLARELGPGYRVTYQGDGSIPEHVVTGTEPAR